MKKYSQEYYKSYKVISVLLLTLMLQHQVTSTLQPKDMINAEYIELNQQLQLLPKDPTDKDLCNDGFVEKTYSLLSLSFMDIFAEVGYHQGVENYSNHLVKLRNDAQVLSEKINAFLTLNIQAKRIISPTYQALVDDQEKQMLKQKANNVFKYQDTAALSVVSQEFVQRLHLDKEIYYFSSTTQKVVERYQQIFEAQKIQSEQQKFMSVFPFFTWLSQGYKPTMRHLDLDMEMVKNTKNFTAESYRFWSIRTYLTSRLEDQTNVAASVKFLKDLKQSQRTIDPKITYNGVDNFSELQIFACDLYASLLFEFQLLVQENETIADKDFDSDFELYEFILDNFQKQESIEGIPVCAVAIQPQEHLINNILKLTIFNPQKNWQSIQFEKIITFLETEPLREYNGELYEDAKNLYEFDMYIIDHLLKKKFHERVEIQELRLIYQQITTHMKKTKHSAQQVDIVYEITVKFLQYLISIPENQEVKRKITDEGIKRSMRMQYLVFTLLRLGALQGDVQDIYGSYEIFIGKFKEQFKRTMNPDEDDDIIEYVIREEWEVTIVITIEIITIMLEGNQTNYMQQIYQTIGRNFRHIKILEFKEGGLHQITQRYIYDNNPIQDRDFITAGIIYRVFINDQIEDMIEYLTNITDESTHNHLKKKKKFFKVLVQVMNAVKKHGDSDSIKQMFKQKIEQCKKEESKYVEYITHIGGYLDKSQQDFFQHYQEVYIQMYKFISWRIQMEVTMNSDAIHFLNFLDMLQSREDVVVKYETSESLYELERQKNLLLDLVFEDEQQKQCSYEDKWNEDMLVDALFLYPQLLLKEDRPQNICQEYDPLVMTKQEAELYQQESDDTLRNAKCINQREQRFTKFLINQEDLQQGDLSPYYFVQALVLSPEFYEFSEQFDFMIDSFQLFRHFRKIAGELVIKDEQIENIYIDIYRFLIHIRSDPDFVYDGDFWKITMKYIHQCMHYQRFSTEQNKMYHCHYGYARYNEMYWFILNAEFEANKNFENMRNALKTKPEVSDKKNIANADKINWGTRTSARFNQFVHYLMSNQSIAQNDLSDQEQTEFKEDNYFKLAIWSECESAYDGPEALDFCKFLLKVAKIQAELITPGVVKDKLPVVLQILKEGVANDNDKIISWEVLDYFQFEQDINHGQIMEKIRELFDAKVLEQIKDHENPETLSDHFKITSIQLLGEYAMSKYDENTTVRNLEESQYGLEQNKQDNALQTIIRNILANKDKVSSFLQLKQKTSHNALFERFQMVHYIPLSLLLYYSDLPAEFQMISGVLVELNKLELLFFSDVDAGALILRDFKAHMKQKFINVSKDKQIYTEQNLYDYIGEVEKGVLKGRKIKTNLLGNSKLGGVNIVLQKTSKINAFKHSLLDKKLGKKGGLESHVSDNQVNDIEMINGIVDEHELSQLNESEVLKINQNASLTELKDVIEVEENKNKINTSGLTKQQKSIVEQRIQDTKDRIINSTSVISNQGLDDEIIKSIQFQNNYQNSQSFVTGPNIIKIDSQNIAGHIKVQKQAVITSVKVIRQKKNSITTQGFVNIQSNMMNRLI